LKLHDRRGTLKSVTAEQHYERAEDVHLAIESGSSRLSWRSDRAVTELRLPSTVTLVALLRSAASGRQDAAQEVGTILFDAVFKGEALDLLDRVYEHVEREDMRAIRLWIEVERADMDELPWELLHDARSRRFLAPAGLSVIRTSHAERVARSQDSRSSLRVLVATASPSDLGPIGAEEARALSELSVNGELDLYVLERSSLTSLRDALEQYMPDVLHVAAHTRREEFGQYSVALEDDGGEAEWVPEKRIDDLLGRLPTVLVVMTAPLQADGIGGGLGRQLLRSGVPTVSMQFPIGEQSVRRFVRSFYRGVLTGLPIDSALASTRDDLGRSERESPLVWASPVLYAQYSDLTLVAEVAPSAAPPRDARIPSTSVDPSIRPDAEGVVASRAEEAPQREPPTEAPLVVEAAHGAPIGEAPQEAPLSEAPDEAPLDEAPEEAPLDEALMSVAVGTLGGANNDSVGDEDQLGFQLYVDAFADLISSPHTMPPLTIGIFGSWGMGKSFLLEHIEGEIARRQEEEDEGKRKRVGPRVHPVRFNAWEYSASEVVWPGLVRKIVGTLDTDVKWPRYKRWWTRLRWNVPRELRRLWVPLVIAALVAMIAIVTAILRDNNDVAAAIIAAVGALSVGGLVKAASDPIAGWVTALLAESDYGRQIGYMEEIKRDLDQLEARLYATDDKERKKPVGRILVLIDDLDRCEPEKAVEVLQAVNLLLNFKSFIVCLGIDARIVTGAVEKHYEGLLGQAGASGYEYLDKIVQIPFRIPEPSEDDIKLFIASQLGNPSAPTMPHRWPNEDDPIRADGYLDAEMSSEPTSAGGPATATFTAFETGGQPGFPDLLRTATGSEESLEAGVGPSFEVEPEAGLASELLELEESEPEAGVPFTWAELQAFETLAPLLRPNPRHLKRLVNVYRLVRSLARARDDDVILGNPAQTIRWLVLWGQWPYTAHAMLRRLEDLLDQWGSEIGDDAPEGDPLRHLHEAILPELDPETRDRLDDETRKLQVLLTVGDGGLTWDELRRIRKYTVNFNPAVEEQLRWRTPRQGQTAQLLGSRPQGQMNG
jgi:KAP family P-loop domain/CHAT domain